MYIAEQVKIEQPPICADADVRVSHLGRRERKRQPGRQVPQAMRGPRSSSLGVCLLARLRTGVGALMLGPIDERPLA